MKKLVIAIMLLAFVPTTAQAGIFDIFKKKAENRQEAARKRLSKTKQNFLKKMEARRAGKSVGKSSMARSSMAKKSAQKAAFKQRTATARDYTVKRSGMYPARPNR